MTDRIVPHFHNTPGVAVIEIGAQEFMCVGKRPRSTIRMCSSIWAMRPKSFALLLDAVPL
jgi:hypothetical protein